MVIILCRIVLIEMAQKKSAPLYLINRDFVYQPQEKNWWWRHGSLIHEALVTPNLKMQNCATGLMVVELMKSQLPVSRAQINTGLKQAQLVGRRQFLRQPFPCWLDVAHNEQSVAWLVDGIRSLPKKGVVRAVFSMLKDKNINGAVSQLIPWVDEWYIAPLPTPRTSSLEELQHCLVAQSAKACYAFDSVAEAVKQAVFQSDQARDCLVVLGSFYTVAAATASLVDTDHLAVVTEEERAQ